MDRLLTIPFKVPLEHNQCVNHAPNPPRIFGYEPFFREVESPNT